MKLDEAKERFIQAWGALGSNWGINRTMAQVHALLLIAPEALCAEEVTDILNISSGNANMNLRALIDWGLIRRERKAGERREYFVAEKDIWRVAMQVILERRKRELAPVLQMLEEVKQIEGDPQNPSVSAFSETIDNLNQTVSQADAFLEFLVKADRHWFAETLLKVLERNAVK